MNEPADIERVSHQLHQVLLRMAVRTEGGRENVAIGQHFAKEIVAACAAARDLIERLSSAPAKDERASPRGSPSDEVVDAMWRIKQWCGAYPADIFRPLSDDQVAKAVEAIISTGITSDALHAQWARHLLGGIGDIANAALEAVQRGEASSSPVADTEAMEAARRIKADPRKVYGGEHNFWNDADTVARALLAQEGARLPDLTQPWIGRNAVGLPEVSHGARQADRAAVIEAINDWADDLARTREDYIEAISSGVFAGRRIKPELAKSFAHDFGERSSAVAGCAELVRALGARKERADEVG
jgi:hypothetical protein